MIRNSLLRSLVAPAALALLAVGLASIAQAAPVVVFQADLYGNRGTVVTGPIQSGWTGITGLNTAAPWTNPYSINGITIALSAAAGNTGWRNDRTQLTVPNVGPLAALYNSCVFAAGGFDLKMTGLTAGTTYNFKIYATDTGNNVGDVHWNYSLAGDKTSPVDAGWVNQPGSTAFTPTANTGITQATKGTAMLSTTFTATGSAVDFFSLTGTVAVLSGFELYAVPASVLAADAGVDKTVSPGTPSVTIGANPTASGGTGPYTYLWSPSTGLSSDTAANPTAAPTTTTIYTVTVTDSLLATASDTVTVNYPLAANAGADKLCTPSSPSTTIGAASTANGGTGPYTYVWTSDPVGFTSTDANPTVSPTEITTYTVQVTDALSAVSTDSVIVTYAVPDPNLISVDFIYSSGSTVASGNTVLTGPANPATDPNMKNAAGEIYTGQVGPWNALNTGGNNANTTSASRTNLLDGSGIATTVAFKMGTATSLGGAGGGWRNNGLGTIIPGSLRQELPYIYYPALTANHYNWELTGLDPGAHYSLTLFGNGGPTYTNIANSVAGVLDSEGDWNWANITANGSGAITGDYLNTAGNNDVRGLYGLQLYKLAVPLVADAGLDRAVSAGLPSIEIGGSPTASGGTGPYTYLWSPSKGLDDATASNPIASPTSTTIYTVTVTDSLNATATDSVTVSFTTPPLVADAGPDKSLTPGAPSAKIGGNPSASGGFPSYTYSWTPATGLDDPMAANPTASPDSPTTYTLTVTDAQTTVATDTVIVDYPLVVSAGPDQIVTPDSPSVPIGGTPTTHGGTGVLIYSWAPATGLDATNVANPIASPTTTTTYTLTVTDALGVVGIDEVTVTYAVPNPNLVSVDFVYAVGGSVAYSGDTTLTGTLNKNATGEIYTGQVGSWNAVNVGGNNANNTSASRTSLLNGAGISTTISFKMGTATAAGTGGGGWRNNFVTAFGNLRQEQSYLYSPGVTVDHYNWELSGLIPKAHYRLTLFGDGGGSYTNTANTVAGALDAEGDWNWADLTADATGLIAGNLLTTGNNDIRGLYGLQLEFLSSSPGSGYDTWAALHAGGQTAEKDFNNDGVQNGIAYFMGMNDLATNPGVENGKVTWPHVGVVASFEVQVSDNLTTWATATSGVDLSDPNKVVFTLLPSADLRKFCRLSVTP